MRCTPLGVLSVPDVQQIVTQSLGSGWKAARCAARPLLVAGGGDARVEWHRTGRHVGTEHGQRPQRRDLAAQFRHLRGRGPAADAPRGDERLHPGHVGQPGQLVGAVLDGKRHHDRADPDDGEERDRDLDRVGQLDADRVPGGDALVEQHLGQPGHLVVELASS